MGDYYYSKSYLLTVLGAGRKSICHGAAGYSDACFWSIEIKVTKFRLK